MRYYLLITFLLFLASSDINGQVNQYYETVLCEGGSYMIGNTVLEKKDHILFVLHDKKDTVMLEKKLIAKWVNPKDHFMFGSGRYHKKKGWFSSIVYTFGGSNFDASGQLGLMYGKLLKPRLGVGLGLGVSYSTANNIASSRITFGELSLYGKYFLSDDRRRLFVMAKVGAALALNSSNTLSYTSGPLLQPGIGIEFASSKRFRWSILISQLLQSTTIIPNDLRNNFLDVEFDIIDKRLFNRTLVGFGLIF